MRPGYGRDVDGRDSLLTHECLIYAVQGKVFVEEAYHSKNCRAAQAKSSDVRRHRTLSGEIPEGEPR